MRDEQMIHIIVISSSESTTRPRPPEDYIYILLMIYSPPLALHAPVGTPRPTAGVGRRSSSTPRGAAKARPAQPRHVAIRI